MKTGIPWLVCLCTGLATLLWTGPVCALTLAITPAFTHQFIGNEVEYLEDSSALLTWDVATQESGWHTYHGSVVNFGFSASAYWLRFQIINASPDTRHLLLENRFPLLDSMAFHFVHSPSNDRVTVLGDATPASQRGLLHSHFLVPLELPPAESVTVLIRVQSASGLQIPLLVWDQKAFMESDHVLSLLYGLLYGLLLAMALYHLLVYFSIRESSFFHYALFNFSLLITYTCLHGEASAYLLPSLVNASNRGIHIGIAASVMFSCLFTLTMLQITQARPLLARILRGLAFLAAVEIMLSLILPYAMMVKWALGLAGLTIIVVSIALVLRVIDGYPPAKIIFLGGICTSVGFAISLAGNLGIIGGTSLTEAAGYVGITAMSMLDAFALSYRMNMDRRLRQEAQAHLIENQREANADLDRLVRERTEELQVANSQLQKISNTDELTQLHNRRHFNDIFTAELKRAFRDKLPLAILLMDIDHFKMINDRYGHPFGDLCLKKAAAFIRASIRRPPDFAARYGGEEFAALLPNTDAAGALHIATLIRDKFNAERVTDGEEEVTITLSIGLVTVVPGPEDTTEALLKQVDKLLYQAKKNGRNRIETALA